MKIVGVIPARLGSTRLKNKVLLDLCGKPVIQHVYEKSSQARMLDDLIVACDDELILETVKSFGGKAVLTSKDHRTGTERLAEVVNEMDTDIVVNIQGDEPLVHPMMIDELARLIAGDKKKFMGTVIRKSHSKEDFVNPNVVKAVVDHKGKVLYFSRCPIPIYLKEGEAFYKHIGLYAYTKDFLFMVKKLPPSFLEINERLEQLRVLENGHSIWAVETNHETIGIDTEEDLEKARSVIASHGN